MKKFLLFCGTLFFVIPCFAQNAIVGPSSTVGPTTIPVYSTVPSFVSTTWVAETNGANIASISSATSGCPTSCGGALTVTAGQLVYNYCRSAGNPTAIVTTDTLGNIWTPLTIEHNGSSTGQTSYSFITTGGSDNFICTTSSSFPYQSLITLVHNAGSLTTLDTQVGSTNAAVASYTSPSFSTSTSNGLIIVCASTSTNSAAWMAGTIGGVSATIRGVSNTGGIGATADSACEELITTSPQTSITAIGLGIGGSRDYVGTVGAFK